MQVFESASKLFWRTRFTASSRALRDGGGGGDDDKGDMLGGVAVNVGFVVMDRAMLRYCGGSDAAVSISVSISVLLFVLWEWVPESRSIHKSFLPMNNANTNTNTNNNNDTNACRAAISQSLSQSVNQSVNQSLSQSLSQSK
mmetsp:Transcript_3497/g.9803  ORF Transcript_3497/g.9803 Transcript_3497/m.9803 type:complete len:142 (-) Transcript_3497:146-571(-)